MAQLPGARALQRGLVASFRPLVRGFGKPVVADVFVRTDGRHAEPPQFPVRVQGGGEDVGARLLFQRLPVAGLDGRVPERVEHVAGEVVGARASRDLRIVAQVLHDERQIVRLIRAGGAIDHRVEADGRVLGAFHHIRVGEDAPPRVEDPVLRAGLVHGRGDVIAAHAGRGRVERARVSLRQSLRPVRPVVPVHDHDSLPSKKSVDVPSGRKLCVRPAADRGQSLQSSTCPMRMGRRPARMSVIFDGAVSSTAAASRRLKPGYSMSARNCVNPMMGGWFLSDRTRMMRWHGLCRKPVHLV